MESSSPSTPGNEGSSCRGSCHCSTNKRSSWGPRRDHSISGARRQDLESSRLGRWTVARAEPTRDGRVRHPSVDENIYRVRKYSRPSAQRPTTPRSSGWALLHEDPAGVGRFGPHFSWPPSAWQAVRRTTLRTSALDGYRDVGCSVGNTPGRDDRLPSSCHTWPCAPLR